MYYPVILAFHSEWSSHNCRSIGEQPIQQGRTPLPACIDAMVNPADNGRRMEGASLKVSVRDDDGRRIRFGVIVPEPSDSFLSSKIRWPKRISLASDNQIG